MREKLAAQVWAALGGAPGELRRLHITGPGHTLRSRFPVTAVGTAAIGAALLAARPGAQVGIDSRQVAVAVRSERHLLREGRSPGNPFDPISAYHRTADGWLRIHANYPWHAAAAREVLGLPNDAGLEQVRGAVAGWAAVDLETALHEAGGVGAAVRTEGQWWATPAGRAARELPLVERVELAPAPPRPRRRPRVLDLTRVIAGPVATRTLAAHGADVLRLDPPGHPEIAEQAWETLPGKRSALLDLADAATREDLLAGADVVVTGYRPGALDRFGLRPEELAGRHPGLVIVTLSAWGHEGPWAHRRGFDSLVQAACGIGDAERPAADGSPPGALPAQLLDHATGYLAAAAALLALAGQRRQGGTPLVRLALAGTAAWLQSLPRQEPGDVGADAVPDVDPTPYVERLGPLTLASPPGTVDGRAVPWPGHTEYGADAPAWTA